METPLWCWLTGISALWLAKFGIWWTVVPIIIFVALCIGGLHQIYADTQSHLLELHYNVYSDINTKSGLRKAVEELGNSRLSTKSDCRLTGSQVIDENLHDIITYIVRDYVSPWYGRLSNDKQFTSSVRETLQSVVIDVSSRIKDVEWINFLTTNLVDDAACHLRIFKQANERTKSGIKKSTPQSLASFKSATQQGHTRSNSDGTGKVIAGHSRNSSIGEKPLDLVGIFFHIESSFQNNRLCHDQICNNKELEKKYLDNILDMILYLVLPRNDFQCVPVRKLVREILINGVILPLFDLFSDPDFVNLCIIRLCSNFGFSSDSFLATIRLTNNKEELIATLDLVNKEMIMLRGRDSGGNNDYLIKQQLSSLIFLKKNLESKIQGGLQSNVSMPKLIVLPLTVLLRNSLALSYFIDYLSSIDMQNYIFFNLSAESWRSSALSERQRPDSPMKKISKAGIENLRESALAIYQQYLLSDSHALISIDSRMEEQLHNRITREPVSESWFDEILSALQKKLKEKCLPEFYRSGIYVKLLADLELLKEGEHDEDSPSPDSLSLAGSLDDEEDLRKKDPEKGEGKFHLKVDIVDSSVVQDKGKTYGIYALIVTKIFENGYTERWDVYRRYSDFYDLQQKVKETYSDLGKLPFPGKKTFNNMEATTLAKRKKMLNDYLQILLHSGIAETHQKLPGFLLAFLEQGDYDKAGSLSSALEFVVSPIKSSMRSVSAAVKTVPDNFLNRVDGLSRTFQPNRKDPARTAAEMLNRNEENVPLRIMLLLMDEVFDLQSRNQWLRRHIVILLRQMFGDIVNRKILDYVENLTAPHRIAEYLAMVKESLWPGGQKMTPNIERDDATRLRTRVLAKTALLSSLPDDLKHLLGSDTSRRGFLRVFETFQYSVLNKRLLYVLTEGALELIFPPVALILSKMSLNKSKG